MAEDTPKKPRPGGRKKRRARDGEIKYNEHGVPVGNQIPRKHGAVEYGRIDNHGAPLDGLPGHPPHSPENGPDGDKVLDAFTDPFATIREAAIAAGVNPEHALRLVERLKGRRQPLYEELKKIKQDELLGTMEDRVWKMLGFMDPEVMAEASLRDIATSFGIMFDKIQLLKNKPTQIISHEERLSIKEALPLLLAEAQRRGMVTDMLPGPDGVYIDTLESKEPFADVNARRKDIREHPEK